MKKKRPSKFEEALAIFKREGYVVTKEGNKYRCVRHPDYCPSPYYKCYLPEPLYTARELVRWSRDWTSDSSQRTRIKKDTKKESKCERAFVRDRLRPHLAEDADVNLPKGAFSDIWSWD